MASTAKQQNYRRLMKEAKVKSSSGLKKIDHPMARYNALDQLSCIICQQTLKSELLWPTHLKSRRHKETVAELKANKDLRQKKADPVSENSHIDTSQEEMEISAPPHSDTPSQPPSALKRVSERETAVASDSPPTKKPRVTFSDVVEVKIATEHTSSLPADFFDPGVSKEGGDGDGDGDTGDVVRGGEAAPATDNSESSKSSAEAVESESAPEREPVGVNDTSQATAIPEGFFDDPKMDAKVRKVEFKDKMEEEWERFQKTIQKENDVSEAIRFEDDEEAQEERDMSEIQEQVECFQKAEALRVKQEQLLLEKRSGTVAGHSERDSEEEVAAAEREVGGSSSSSDEDDDELINELEMDWRAKHS